MTKETPLVSVLMLTYNRALYLKEAIASVLAQTYQNFELIIIDDGSTDNTAEVVDSYQDSRIRYIKHENNAGLFARRKESLSYAQGEYIAVLDSDDLWIDTDKLTKQVEAMVDEPTLAVVGTQVRLIDEKGQTLRDYFYHTRDQKIRQNILLRNQFTHSAVLMRADFVKKTLGYQPTLAEDLELFLQLGKLGTFKNLESIATAHRVHGNSMNDHGPKMSKAVYEIVIKHKDSYPHKIVGLLVSWLRYKVNLLIKS